MTLDGAFASALALTEPLGMRFADIVKELSKTGEDDVLSKGEDVRFQSQTWRWRRIRVGP